jgi:hypothetical protein
MKRNTQQEETKMEQQNQPQEYRVTINEHAGSVRVEGDTFLFDNGSYTERHSFVALVNKARRGELPSWASQLPNLAARIERVFAEEQKQGIDPHVRFANGDGKLTRIDLRSGVSISSSVADLKKLLDAGKPLPKAFSSPRAKELLSLAA